MLQVMKILHSVLIECSSGARPLTESYVVLIYAFLKEKNIKNAEAVFSSMLRPNAGADAEQGQFKNRIKIT